MRRPAGSWLRERKRKSETNQEADWHRAHNQDHHSDRKEMHLEGELRQRLAGEPQSGQQVDRWLQGSKLQNLKNLRSRRSEAPQLEAMQAIESCHKSHMGRSLPIYCSRSAGSQLWKTFLSAKLNHTARCLVPADGKPARTTQLSPLVILIVIAAICCCCCLPQPAASYQLTNNLIASNVPPKFITSGTGANAEIVVRVKEGPGSNGQLICTLRGEDTEEDPITFGVLGSTASDLLRIENVPGNQANVYLKKELDRETTVNYQVVITLTDGKLGRGNWITKSMLIIVEDVNDNYPVFGPHRTAIAVREDAKAPLVIETIEATDQDEGRFGQVVYKLDESLEADSSTGSGHRSPIGSIFGIETIDGKAVISLIGNLDYEQRALYQLRVLATDRATETERLTASTSILISVEDCEDQPPMFTFVPSITRIPENLPVGSPVVRVTAVDGDRGINNRISYKLLAVNGQPNGPERELFQLDPDSGLVSVAQKLDREADGGGWSATGGRKSAAKQDQQPGSYVLQVRAAELGSSQPEASVTTELTVLLTDVNDELPSFNQAAYAGEILENSAPESLVSFVAQTETQDSQLQTSGSGSQELARVVDRDQGTNGTFSLHLEGEQSRLFEIWPREATNEANFLIKIAPNVAIAELDFERRKRFQFTLIAREKYPPNYSDQTSRFTSAQMTVFVRDSNDNYPQFEHDLYRVEIPENAIKGMHVCQVRALDADSGAYGTEGIRYTEIRGEKASKFRLDPVTGVVTLKTSEHGFDRETVGQHHLIVEARDSNGLGNRNTTQLLIQLTDVNDQAPKFLLDQYEAFIYENELDFQSPLQVQAIDNDLPNSPNSRLTYSIVSGDPQQNFTIDPASGRIRIRAHLQPAVNLSKDAAGTSGGNEPLEVASLNGGLDFERIAQKRDDTRQFNLTIRATDSGVPEPLSDTTNVLVLVYDKNDHAPVFTRPVYFKSIKEDAKEGSQVLQVLAQDGDHSPTNSKITYRISSGGSDKFAIDSETGLISVAPGANLDIDRAVGGQKRSNYLLSVLAFDGSFGPNQKSASTLVNITILDVNNKAPEFTTLGATRSTASSFYSQTTLAPQQLPAGGQNPNNQQQQQQQFMVVHVNEDAPYGLIVTRVVASDPDSGAELRYSINYARSEARNDDMQLVDPALIKDLFSIEPQEGTIKVAKPLDRETFDQVKLRLQVEDIAAQTADQVAHAHLLVKITDVNDNRPAFKRPLYKAVVNENSISGTSVITLTADDRDLNKTLKYSLEGAPEVMRLIRINSRSGEVTVNDKIDRELYSLLNVTVRAEDSGHPHPLSGTSQLLITVRDENDNNPAFVGASQLGIRQQRKPPATNIPETFQPPNHNMNDTGYRLRSLTSGSQRSFGAPSEPEGAESVATLAPEVESLPLLAPGATARISEDAPIGHQLAYVRAEDADLANNGRVSYLLDALSSDGKFRIDRDSGIISVAGPLDRESVKQYSLIIEACDNYELGYATGESRRAFTQVNVQLTDVNDNAPSISTNLQQAAGRPADSAPAHPAEALGPSHDEVMSSPGPYEMALGECLFISEFQPIDEPILTISATDADDPATANGQVELAIVNNLPQNELFGLVSVSGASGTTTTTTTSPSTDFLGFADLSMGETSASEVHLANSTASGRPKRAAGEFGEEETPKAASSQLEPSAGNIYSQLNRAAASASVLRSRAINQQSRQTSRQAAITTTTTTTTTATPLPGRASQRLQRPAGELGEQQVHLVVRQSLKERVGNYSILVRATDRGQPALSTVKLVNICVQDVNNHAPVFMRPPLNHTIRIHENATLGTYVTQVEASDSDHGLNGELHYSLKQAGSNLDWQSFKIDRLSGVITTAKLFNRQLKKYYNLRVQAQDFGKPTSLSNDIDLNIMIVNSGQYQPEFDQQTQQLQFTENVAPGVEWFTLLPTTNLDDDPALINAPQATSGLAKVVLKADGSTSERSASEQASWLATPCYFIVDSDDQDQIFHLDRYTHHLTNQKTIDRERKANYTLIVQASNSCNQPPTSTRKQLAPLPGELSTTPPAIDYRSSSVELAEPASGANLQVGSVEMGGGSEELKISLRSRRAAPPASSTNNNNRTLEPAAKAAKLTGPAPADFDRFNPAAVEALLAADKTLLRVLIKIKDVNDNAPKFTQKVYTGGITTEADFGTVFMIVQALDADADQNSQVVYSLVKPVKRNLAGVASSPSSRNLAPGSKQRQRRAASGSQTMTTFRPTAFGEISDSPSTNDIPEGEELFVINAQTGEISLNFDPQKHMKGYFEFEVMANDTDGLFDSAKVYIYLLRQDQRVKFVLRLTPQELRQRLNKFRSVIGNITGAIVNIDSYKYYENHDGTVDKKKTSLYLHFVNLEDNTIIEVDKVLTMIDNNIEYLDELYKEFHVLSSEAAQLPLGSSALIDPADQVRTGLMGVSSFLALILVLVIALFLNQRNRYERQLKAATVSAFGSSPLHLSPDFQSQTNLPNTNLHSQDPNPIWVNGYHDQDWLGTGGEAKNEALQQSSGRRSQNHPKRNRPEVEEADYLSSENSSENSLSGAHSVVHYNAATTATPRDSLSSSQGRVSGSAGSNSTTNERQALCQPTAAAAGPASGRCQTPSGQPVIGVLKNGKPLDPKSLKRRPNQQQQQFATSGGHSDTGNHSTFGAFKEVTIYTEEQLDKQRPAAGLFQAGAKPNSNNLVRTINADRSQQQQLPTSQVNKLASHFNSRQQQQQQQLNNHQAANKSNGLSQVYIGQHQQHRIVVHANGADPTQGIIKINPAKTILAGKAPKQFPASYPTEQPQTTTDNIDTNLSKLSILNLETTEL